MTIFKKELRSGVVSFLAWSASARQSRLRREADRWITSLTRISG